MGHSRGILPRDRPLYPPQDPLADARVDPLGFVQVRVQWTSVRASKINVLFVHFERHAQVRGTLFRHSHELCVDSHSTLLGPDTVKFSLNANLGAGGSCHS